MPDPFAPSSMARGHNDIEKPSPCVSIKASTDTGSDCTRTYQSSRAQSQCDHCYELVESPQPERRPSRPRARGVPAPVTSPCHPPPEHRRPSVQSILDEIVVTQPPSAIMHEALGSNFPIRVVGHVQPLAQARGRFSSIDTVTGEGLSAPRPRIRRMASEGSQVTSWREQQPRSARGPVDYFNRVDFRAVGWAGSANPSIEEGDHAPRDIV